MRTFPADSSLPAGVGENPFLLVCSEYHPCCGFYCCVSNWTSSQTSCMTRKAHLARFDSLEELDFLKRHKNDSARWIGLHRKSSEHSWRWTDNTKYNNLVSIRGEGECAYLSDRGISSSKNYMPRKWICCKPKS
ncbi:C-type lectin domain family 2 member F-like isoform X3 [Peromyscus californicus insignis]|uniref:C-type lectin domain family 2 member F-like isoform X3 n=1 Tax=Peromyscus californicus insignis TaxID=564181 RepID=UPI0022A67138|nr:C-type lectin domain family 2 member F-like isoform X3 [Peromyscus californicus insignis]